jgi:hypothetical protein
MYVVIIFGVPKSTSLPAVLCGFGTWCLTLREEHTSTLRVSENRTLKRIFGLQRFETI